jgi:uncharacterized paraquat-inducible protein A
MNRNPRVLIAIVVAAFFGLNLLTRQAVAATQDNWRYCWKCHAMFYNGTPETPKAQTGWRFCSKCNAMFYDGYPQKGACPAGGGHFAQGFNFTLPHDVPAQGVVQAEWRYCEKCHCLFHEGEGNKGRCSSGGGHVAQGYNFVLRYRGNLENDVQLNPVHE